MDSEGSIEDSSWRFQALESSALWRSKRMRSDSWRRRFKTRQAVRFLCGAMLEPSTAVRGVESWTESLRATRANPSPSLAEDLDAAILATYGPTFVGSLAKLAQASFSLRTSMPTLITDISKFSEISSVLATQLRRDCSRREQWALRIRGIDFSSLDWMSPRAARGTWTRDHGKQGEERLTIEGQAIDWTTPTAMDSYPFNRSPEQIAAKRSNKKANSPGCRNLVDEAQEWRTPDTGAGGASGKLKQGMSHRETGHAITQMWTTPTVSSTHGAESSEQKKSRNAGGENLQHQSREWGTPTARDHKTGGMQGQLSTQICLFSLTEDQASSINGGGSLPDTRNSPLRLNPMFTEHLMGWPIGSTGFGSVGMEWSLWSQRMRSALYGLVCEAGSK